MPLALIPAWSPTISPPSLRCPLLALPPKPAMIVCPNCEHANPEGALHCENCSTPLPSVVNCPSCGASVQSDASFCGQCGFDLRSGTVAQAAPSSAMTSAGAEEGQENEVEIPELMPPDPLVSPEPIAGLEPSLVPDSGLGVTGSEGPTLNEEAAHEEAAVMPPSPAPEPREGTAAVSSTPDMAAADPSAGPVNSGGEPVATQLQVSQSRLIHLQTNTTLELPPNLSPLHIGKPNDRIPPDIDVSGFPNSEIVSRVHADIRVEGDVYYIEDVNSSNGTYINNLPLPPGNRHRLRPGDRIALGKGDKVTFIFQTS